MTKKITKAVFPVAGLATRFMPATKSVPKELLPLVDKPILQYAVEEAIEAGIEEFIFISSRRKPAIEQHFSPLSHLKGSIKNDCNIDPNKLHIVYQDEPLGLGHAVLCAKDIIQDDAFAVILPDDLVLNDVGALKQMVDAYRTGVNFIACMDVPDAQVPLYGIINGIPDHDHIKVKSLVEKPNFADAPSNTAIIGRYILQPQIFAYLEDVLKKTSGTAEVQLTTAISALVAQQDVYGFRFKGERYDCGHCVGWLEANIAYALQRPEMNAAVEQMLQKRRFS